MAIIVTYPPVGNSVNTTRRSAMAVIVITLIGMALYLQTWSGASVSNSNAPSTKAASMSNRDTPVTDTALVAP